MKAVCISDSFMPSSSHLSPRARGINDICQVIDQGSTGATHARVGPTFLGGSKTEPPKTDQQPPTLAEVGLTKKQSSKARLLRRGRIRPNLIFDELFYHN